MRKKYLYKNLIFCLMLTFMLFKSVHIAYSESIQDASSNAIAEKLFNSIFNSALPAELNILVLTPKPQFTLQKSDESSSKNIQNALIQNLNTYSGITAFSDSSKEEKIFALLTSTSVSSYKTNDALENLQTGDYALLPIVYKKNGGFYLTLSLFDLASFERLAFTKTANYESVSSLYGDFGAAEEAVSSICRSLKLEQTEIADFVLESNLSQEAEAERLTFSLEADSLYAAGDYKGALKLYKKAANKDDSYALKKLGDMYFLGEGCSQSYSTALSYYKKAAGKNNVEAQTILGIMYENGLGTKQNYAYAAIWYERASRKNAVAQNNLGVMYETARGLVQDYERAFSLYSSASQNGIVEAQNNLGVLYETGRGTKADLSKAFELYKKAADAGNTEALCNLGILFDMGKGVAQDYTTSANYYKQAADAGSAVAQNNLGILYNNGRGVSRSSSEAKALWEKAKKQGDICATNNLSILNGESKTAITGYTKAEAGYTNGTSSSVTKITSVSNASLSQTSKEEASDAEK